MSNSEIANHKRPMLVHEWVHKKKTRQKKQNTKAMRVERHWIERVPHKPVANEDKAWT